MPRKTYQEKRSEEFRRLCRLHRLALEQSDRARDAGQTRIADGCLERAAGFQREIECHVAVDRENTLLKKRSDVGAKLRQAMTACDRDKIRELTAELAAIDAQIQVA